MRTWQYAEINLITSGNDQRYRLGRVEGLDDDDLAGFRSWEVFTGNRGSQIFFTSSPVLLLNHLGGRGWRFQQLQVIHGQTEVLYLYSLSRSSDDALRR